MLPGSYPDYLERTGYRLETSDEWKAVALAGAKTTYPFGENKKRVEGYGIFAPESKSVGAPVGRMKPNDYGIFDMPDSVREWVSDSDGNGVRRGLCGQSYYRDLRELVPPRVAYDTPELSYTYQGFRVVRSIPHDRP